MPADKASALVPRLRFPEFQDAGEWDRKRLGDVLKVGYGRDYRHLAKGDVPVYGTGGYMVSVDAHLYDGESVCIGRKGTIDSPMLLEGRFWTTDTLFYTHSFGDCLPRFMYLVFQQIPWKNYNAASGVPSLSKTTIEEIVAGLPELGEQSKIADCLTSLDDLIAAADRKLEALRQHKQGLMQQLFPQPGENVPRLRFPEFEGASEWVSRELGPMSSKVGSGITPRGGQKNYRPSGRPFVRSQNVGWGELALDNVVHIDEDTHASFTTTEIEEGDVLLNISGASIGRSAVADARIAGGNVNQHVCVIRGLSEQIKAGFLCQYLISKQGQEQIDSCQAGGNRQGLNFGQIRSFSIPRPRDVAEQQRIADCLGSLDNLVAAKGRRLDALRLHKQGLMQQLFPAPNAPAPKGDS